MIPILWRYLLQGYLKVFLLSVCTFVSVLIVSRFKEIARFAALSGDLPKTGLFMLYQIPFILPLAIPISALVSAFLLFQRLSRSCELVAFRASGLSFRLLLWPILLAAFFLGCFNFSFCADISPFCWRESKALLYRETSANPLLLMQRQNLVKIKHAYLKMDVKANGKEAGDFILIAHNASSSRLNFISARNLVIANSKLLGYDFSILSHLQTDDADAFDPLIIENQAEMSTAAPVLSAALKKNRPRLEANALSLRMLRFRAQESGKHARGASSEIMRRISLAAAVFTFTLLGCAFGMQASRGPSKKWLFIALLLALFVLLSYLGLKEIRTSRSIAFALTFLPHLLIGVSSTFRIHWIARGKG
jgi:lipopolysaccharide export system permease protein